MKIVKVSETFMTQNYNWYIARCLYKKNQKGEIKLIINKERPEEKLATLPWIGQHVHIIYIDDFPIIIDTRDSTKFPMQVFESFPESKIIKFQYSSEIYNNPPESYEDKISEYELKFLDKVYPFVGGRGMTLDFDVDELNFYTELNQPSKKFVSYTGEGIYPIRTDRRLEVFDLFSESNVDIDLIFYHRNHFSEKYLDDDYLKRIKKYQKQEFGIEWNNQKLWKQYKEYIKWLSTGEFSINIPGIACSQPFRLLDSIFAKRKIISTKIWIDAYKDFPCIKIPFDGYFKESSINDIEKSIEIIKNCKPEDINFNDILSWYNKYLSVEGIWKQIEYILEN